LPYLFFDSGTAKFIREDGVPDHNHFDIAYRLRKGKKHGRPSGVDRDANRMLRIDP
jgi:hypothetical protein